MMVRGDLPDDRKDDDLNDEVVPLMKRYSRMSQIGLEFGAPAIIGLLIDLQFDILPWCTLFGALFGLVIGMVHLFKLSKQSMQENDKP